MPIEWAKKVMENAPVEKPEYFFLRGWSGMTTNVNAHYPGHSGAEEIVSLEKVTKHLPEMFKVLEKIRFEIREIMIAEEFWNNGSKFDLESIQELNRILELNDQQYRPFCCQWIIDVALCDPEIAKSSIQKVVSKSYIDEAVIHSRSDIKNPPAKAVFIALLQGLSDSSVEQIDRLGLIQVFNSQSASDKEDLSTLYWESLILGFFNSLSNNGKVLAFCEKQIDLSKAWVEFENGLQSASSMEMFVSAWQSRNLAWDSLFTVDFLRGVRRSVGRKFMWERVREGEFKCLMPFGEDNGAYPLGFIWFVLEVLYSRFEFFKKVSSFEVVEEALIVINYFLKVESGDYSRLSRGEEKQKKKAVTHFENLKKSLENLNSENDSLEENAFQFSLNLSGQPKPN